MKLNLETKLKSDEIIKAYLEENASKILADKINNGVFIEKDGKRLLNRKSLSSFMKYANEEARKLAEQGVNSTYVDDPTVFGWAIHYFEEDSIEGTLYNEDGSEYKKSTPVKNGGKSTYTPTSAPVAKKAEPQLSLFDMIKDSADNDEPYNEPVEDYPEEQIPDEKPETTVEPEVKPERKGSPLYEEYKKLALQYPDCIVCYRLGDFYEVLGKKAYVVADELELTLTGRDCGLENRVPMVGFPYHVADRYISKLVSNGHKVATAEQLGQITLKSPNKPIIDVNTETGEIISEEKPDDEILNNHHKGALLALLELFDDDATIG